jgi:hypothetical protein
VVKLEKINKNIPGSTNQMLDLLSNGKFDLQAELL